MINNAGVYYPPYEESSDGYESTLQVNYFAPYLLTRLLIPILNKATAPRVVNVSSLAYSYVSDFSFDDPNLKSGWDLKSKQARYSQSKLALLLFTKEMARKHPNILSVALHPGLIAKTAIFRDFVRNDSMFGLAGLFFRFLVKNAWMLGAISLEEGALTSLYGATDPSLNAKTDNGNFYMPIAKLTKCTKTAEDVALAEKLWTWTEQQLAEKGYL